MTTKLLFIFVIVVSVSYSQELTKQEKLSSLYGQLISFSKVNESLPSNAKPQKCGFGLFSQIKANYNNYSSSQQAVIAKILQRPSTQTSILSPSGHFRIHFDTTGTNAPHYNSLSVQASVDSIIQAADSAYNFEVNYLGYPPPPPDFNAGGDNSYDIYIQNLSGSYYGYTEPDQLISATDSTYTAYMVIDNAYSPAYNFATTGLNGAKVTIAHEFHHGIQIGNYTYRYDTDGFFYELTSVSMEAFVYPSIHDYYNYLPAYFNDPSNAFGCINCAGGDQEYALGIWNIFLQQRYRYDGHNGYDIIKKQWELMPKMRAMNAINAGLNEVGSSFKKEFTKFSAWLYFTNKRSISGKYFPDAKNYPLLKPIQTITFNSSYNSPLSVASYPTAQNFIMFINSGNNDSLAVFITNNDLKSGVDNLHSTTQFTYNLYDYYQPGTNNLNGKYYSQLVVQNSYIWGETEILNGEVVHQDTTSPVIAGNINYAYPNPFRYGTSKGIINIPVNAKLSDPVYVNIYSVSMHLVYSGNLPATPGPAGNIVVKWIDPRGNNGTKLASGVYIYLTKDGDNTTSGKIVIFNE